VSYQFVLLPFITVLASAWLTGEVITLPLLLGGGLVLVGVWVGAISRGAGSENSPA
jgi:drug/metabolite transporter (DMT)-like permease